MCMYIAKVSKVRPFMKIKKDEGKENYDLQFILESGGANGDSVLQARCNLKCKGDRDRGSRWGSRWGCKHIIIIE